MARQLSEMYRLGADITVLVPVVWCPAFLRFFKRWQGYNHTRSLCKYDGLKTIPVPHIRPPGNWYNRWAGLAAFWAMRKKVLELHKKEEFDVIYATDFFPDGDAAARLARYINVPAACLGIGVDVNITARSSKIMYRHFVRTARALDGTLACGRSVADAIDAVTGRCSLRVYGVVDLQEFSPAPNKVSLRKTLGLPLDKTVALYAGYLMKRKGIYELAEVLCRIQKTCPNTLLVMCGGGPEEAGLQTFIRERNIERMVRLVGEVEPEQMSKWMQASDLFVLATHTEGMPNVVMEAMACGLPVVTTQVGGLPDAVGDCQGVALVPPKDIDAFADVTSKLLQDERLRRHMGSAARRKAEERFGVKQNARLILDYLQQVIEEKLKKTESN